MVADGVPLRRGKTLSFDGPNVQELRPFEISHDLERVHQLRQIMAIEWANVVPAQLFEHSARCHHALHVFFRLFGQIPGAADMLKNLLGALTQCGVGLAGPDLGEVGCQPAGVVPNRHLVVIQNDQHIRAFMARMSQRLESHATSDRAVSNDGNDLAVDALFLCRQGHTHRRGDAGRGVAHAEGVEGALGALGKPRQAIELSHAVHAIAPSGQNFVGVGLVPDIPHDAIVGGIENMVQRHRQFDYTQPGTKMPPGACYRVEQVVSKLFGQLHQFVTLQL